jgi:hypothetical protein
MKINNDNHEQSQQQVQDLTEIFMNLQKEYHTIYIHQIDDQVFMYRPLGRSEFKRLIEDERFNDMQKEEIVCQACVLWPEEYDYEECEAGIPTNLTAAILKSSYLDSIESRKSITTHYRQEMFDLDNQITCIINEAFPQFDIEEIEQWDIAKTAKYLSRAEWKLMNLRGLEMKFDPNEQEAPSQSQQPQQSQEVHTEEIEDSPIKHGKIETIEERQARLNKKGGEKKKLTPEELLELKRKYPEMKWGDNALQETTVDNLKDSVDVASPALRPGW